MWEIEIFYGCWMSRAISPCCRMDLERGKTLFNIFVSLRAAVHAGGWLLSVLSLRWLRPNKEPVPLNVGRCPKQPSHGEYVSVPPLGTAARWMVPMWLQKPLCHGLSVVLLPWCHRDRIKVAFLFILAQSGCSSSIPSSSCFVFFKTQEQKPIYKTQAPLDKWQTPSS